MAAPASSGGPIVGINVTPLVDIVLVLLIVFIVTAKLVVAPAVPLDLPHATKSEQVQTILSIALETDGSLHANGAKIPDKTALLQLAKSQLERDPGVRVVIAADGSVHHRRVIELLDTLRSGGVSHVAFGVSPNNEAQP